LLFFTGGPFSNVFLADSETSILFPFVRCGIICWKKATPNFGVDSMGRDPEVGPPHAQGTLPRGALMLCTPRTQKKNLSAGKERIGIAFKSPRCGWVIWGRGPRTPKNCPANLAIFVLAAKIRGRKQGILKSSTPGDCHACPGLAPYPFFQMFGRSTGGHPPILLPFRGTF